MKKELPHYTLGASYGGNQEWFATFMMRLGGCAAETAMECCIYLDKYRRTALCPFDTAQLTRADYVAFSEKMKPYLYPRWHGIDRLSIFLDGFGAYLRDAGSDITLTSVEGDTPYDEARDRLLAQIDRGLPVPYLCLMHRDLRFKEYQWHWFLLNGYERAGDTLMVKAVTYSAFEWLDFKALWHSGYPQKGGMILLHLPA